MSTSNHFNNFRETGKQMFHSVRRQNARKTARAKSDTLLEDGYRFTASASRLGVINVHRPGEEEVAYEIQLFRDPASGTMLYRCPCAFFQEEEKICPGGGWCKHVRRLRKEFSIWVPLVKSALAAPTPSTDSTSSAVPPQNFATALNQRPARTAGESYPQFGCKSGYRGGIPPGARPVRIHNDNGSLRWAWEN